MIKPLVSIIIPTKNRAHLISETLDSILAQTYTNWECIVVDDGSVDGTKELLQNYIVKDTRFQYHKRPDTYLPGGNGARNFGFELSKGEYVNWFDSDDLMLPRKLKIQIKLLHQTSYNYTICQTMMYNIENDKVIGLRAKSVYSEQIFDDYIRFKIFWLTQAPLWKRSFLDKYNLKFNESLKQSQDYDFHIRVLAVSENYSFTEEPLVTLRCHSDNMSNSLVENEEKIESNLYVKNMIFERYGDRISLETKRIVFTHILEIYRQVVYSRSLKKMLIVLPSVLNHFSDIKITFSKQLTIVFKLFLGSFLYLIFRRGYSCLKIKI